MAGAAIIKQVKLEKESELRTEVANDAPLRLRVLNGTAEIIGTELPPEIWISFPPCLKFVLFTWYGATIEMDGATKTNYTADETPMVSYVNVHAVLDGRRNRAKASSPHSPESSQGGPRVIVVGPTDPGKSTLSRMLLSWAAKGGWKPMFVDLDIGQGSITIPGCIAATPVELPIDVVEGISLEMPLVYFYGHTTPSQIVDSYKALVKELAQILERHFAMNADSRASGMVINTMGWIEGVGYEEKLFSMLRDVLRNKPNVDVVKLHKSGGVVSRSPSSARRPEAIKLGWPTGPEVSFANWYRPCCQPSKGHACEYQSRFAHVVLAVSYAQAPDQIISSNVAGFIICYRRRSSEEENYISYTDRWGSPKQIFSHGNLDMASDLKRLFFLFLTSVRLLLLYFN